MIIYNVTCHVDDDMAEEWKSWMQNVHLPEVMATGKFISFEFLSVQKHDPADPGQSFAIMYRAESMAQYLEYEKNHAPELREKSRSRYGDRVVAFRTLLESI